jgi:hypothetical protein
MGFGNPQPCRATRANNLPKSWPSSNPFRVRPTNHECNPFADVGGSASDKLPASAPSHGEFSGPRDRLLPTEFQQIRPAHPIVIGS